MLPGTYTPTHPLELAAIAADTLRKRWNESSGKLASIEEKYHDIGIAYHRIPRRLREEDVAESIRDDTVKALIVAPGENGQADRVPDIVLEINKLRELRERGQRCMWDHDVEQANKLLDEADPTLRQVQMDVYSLGAQVGTIEAEYKRRGSSFLEMAEETADRLAGLRRFVLALPENVAALELGLMEDEDQAFEESLKDEDKLIRTSPPRDRDSPTLFEEADAERLPGVDALLGTHNTPVMAHALLRAVAWGPWPEEDDDGEDDE